jgi:precorrin-2/cobalt-factor-2 C20-methyltransferase
MATVFALGVGPGDPELLTLRAARILGEVPVICAPTANPSDSSYALSIVESFLDRSRQEVLVRVFPMKKEQEGLEDFWEKTAAEVAGIVEGGRDVAFITIGDPLLYSTFLYLFRIFREKYPEIPVEVVPGVSSITAAAAAAGLPLAMAAERLAVIPATYEEEKLVETLVKFDTVVLMKVNRVFDRVHEILKRLQPERTAVFVSRAGTAEQRVVTDLDSLVGKELDYLSLLIVKKTG